MSVPWSAYRPTSVTLECTEDADESGGATFQFKDFDVALLCALEGVLARTCSAEAGSDVFVSVDPFTLRLRVGHMAKAMLMKGVNETAHAIDEMCAEWAQLAGEACGETP